jgi:hypothetical protein
MQSRCYYCVLCKWLCSIDPCRRLCIHMACWSVRSVSVYIPCTSLHTHTHTHTCTHCTPTHNMHTYIVILHTHVCTQTWAAGSPIPHSPVGVSSPNSVVTTPLELARLVVHWNTMHTYLYNAAALQVLVAYMHRLFGDQMSCSSASTMASCCYS